VFLSFDWAKDQTLYGKDGLRALPESRKFNEGVGFFKAQMPFSGPFMNFQPSRHSPARLPRFSASHRALPKMFLFWLLSFPRY
ncbi:MAG: hypothetical protein KJ754_15965, partial [Bacteroidetes bacterium]|nr:hypothetical protein [Bacteroidota bacterium]